MERISSYNLVVLLVNFIIATRSSSIGFQESSMTFEEMMERTKFTTLVRKDILESLLYYCNMLEEDNEFWHPSDINVNEFVRRILQDKKLLFDKKYNLLEKEE